MRIDPREMQDCPWYLRPFFWNQLRKYGAALDAALLWARSAKLFLGVAFLNAVIDRKSSPIDPPVRSLATVRASQPNWCRFCGGLNSVTHLKHGASIAKVEASKNWRESSLFEKREHAALANAEAMTLSDQQVEDTQMIALREHFDDAAVVELTGLIAFQNLSSKSNAALVMPPHGFCRLPNDSNVSAGNPAANSGL